MSDVDLREVLSRAVLDLPATPPDPARTIRRARLRVARTVVGAAVVVVAVAAAITGLLELSDRAAERPAGRVTTEIPIPGEGHPVALAADADGVWLVRETPLGDGWRGDLLRIERDGRITQSIPVGTDSAAVTFRMEVGYGAAWVLSSSRQVLVRVDEATGATSEISVPGVNPSVSVGAGGVWLTRTIGELLRVDPVTGRTDPPIAVGGRPIGLAAAHGTIWISDDFDGTIRRVDPETGRVVAEISTGADLGTDIVADHRGAWTVGCRPVDGSGDARAALDGCWLELLFVDARTNAIAWSTPLDDGAGLYGNARSGWAVADAVDRHGVWVTMSHVLCDKSSFAPCDGDLLVRVSHAGDILDHEDLGIWVGDVDAADGSVWISDWPGQVIEWIPEG